MRLRDLVWESAGKVWAFDWPDRIALAWLPAKWLASPHDPKVPLRHDVCAARKGWETSEGEQMKNTQSPLLRV